MSPLRSKTDQESNPRLPTFSTLITSMNAEQTYLVVPGPGGAGLVSRKIPGLQVGLLGNLLPSLMSTSTWPDKSWSSFLYQLDEASVAAAQMASLMTYLASWLVH